MKMVNLDDSLISRKSSENSLASVLLVQAAELAALFSRMTTCEGEVLKQKKEMNAPRVELYIYKTELQRLTADTVPRKTNKPYTRHYRLQGIRKVNKGSIYWVRLHVDVILVSIDDFKPEMYFYEEVMECYFKKALRKRTLFSASMVFQN